MGRSTLGTACGGGGHGGLRAAPRIHLRAAQRLADEEKQKPQNERSENAGYADSLRCAIHAGACGWLVWRGEIANLPPAEVARCFDNSLLTLRAEDAIAALQRGPQQPGTPKPPPRNISPILAGQMYENVASRALMEHCLDNNALALAGWPTEDVLYSMRHTPQQPSHAVIHRLMKAIDHEQSLETFEDIMSEDPILSYRFMIYTNSAALGLRTGIDSLRRGMVMMGYESIQRWLSDQLPHSSTEPNMQPIREAMVMRARLTTLLLKKGLRNVWLRGARPPRPRPWTRPAARRDATASRPSAAFRRCRRVRFGQA